MSTGPPCTRDGVTSGGERTAIHAIRFTIPAKRITIHVERPAIRR